MADPALTVLFILILLEDENPLDISQNVMHRVRLYLQDRAHYLQNRKKWGSTISDCWWKGQHG